MKEKRPNKRTIVGVVISDKMDKGITVELKTQKRHPLYKKFVKKHSKVKAHDEKNAAVVGDLVKLVESRPFSKDKCWRIVEVLEKAQRG
ncbi:MAG: 30S ribosomal protein S17 [Candidatus Omnitrophota bacterium]